MSECQELCGCGMPCQEGSEDNHRVVGGELLHACEVHWPRDVPGAIGVPFQTIKLVTGDGDELVAFGEIPNFKKLPEVVMWGIRTFKQIEPESNKMPRYKEVFAVAVVKWKLKESETAGYNGGES